MKDDKSAKATKKWSFSLWETLTNLIGLIRVRLGFGGQSSYKDFMSKPDVLPGSEKKGPTLDYTPAPSQEKPKLPTLPPIAAPRSNAQSGVTATATSVRATQSDVTPGVTAEKPPVAPPRNTANSKAAPTTPLARSNLPKLRREENPQAMSAKRKTGNENVRANGPPKKALPPDPKTNNQLTNLQRIKIKQQAIVDENRSAPSKPLPTLKNG